MKLIVLGILSVLGAALVCFVGMMIATDEALQARPFLVAAMILFPLGVLLIVLGIGILLAKKLQTR